MNIGHILSINVSDKKGTIKKPVNKVIVDKNGIINDAHYGTPHRYVSFLSVEDIRNFEQIYGKKINYGEFAENITTQDIDLSQLKLLDKLIINNIIFEITQIGKKCHGEKCEIFKTTGDCIMPKKGLFARVIGSGEIQKNDQIIIEKKKYRIASITLSNRAFNGIYEDISGNKIKNYIDEFVEQQNINSYYEYSLIDDNYYKLEKKLNHYIENDYDIIFTTGGTGIGIHDITYEVIKSVIDKEIPGIMDYIRLKSAEQNLNALISRSIAGVKKNTLIFSLPGNIKAIDEYMTIINKLLMHLIYMINNLDTH